MSQQDRRATLLASRRLVVRSAGVLAIAAGVDPPTATGAVISASGAIESGA